MGIWYLLNHIFDIFTLGFWINEDVLINETSAQVKELKKNCDKLLAECDDFLINDTEVEKLNKNFSVLLGTLDIIKETPFITSENWAELNDAGASYFNKNSTILEEQIHASITQLYEELIDCNSEGLNLIVSTGNQLIIHENTTALYNISRLMNAIGIFENNSFNSQIAETIPADGSWPKITKENFFCKLNSRDLIKEQVVGTSQSIFTNEVSALHELLKKNIKKYI